MHSVLLLRRSAHSAGSLRARAAVTCSTLRFGSWKLPKQVQKWTQIDKKCLKMSSKMSSKWALGALVAQKWPKWVPGPLFPEIVVTFGAFGLQKGGHFETKNGPKIKLISRVGKVGHLEGPRVAKWTLGTSKMKQNHCRGSQFQLFTVFSPKSLFGWFSSSRGSFLEHFGSHFWIKNQSKKWCEKGRAKGGARGGINLVIFEGVLGEYLRTHPPLKCKKTSTRHHKTWQVGILVDQSMK